MQHLLALIEGSALAGHLRGSRWTYPLVNAGHVLGLALLFGAIVPLDLRLLGVWARRPLAWFVGVLRPVSAAGAALALVTGVLLFSVNAREYAGMPMFQSKLALVAVGLTSAALHAGRALDALPVARQRLAGALSLGVWTSVIVLGRLLGYQ